MTRWRSDRPEAERAPAPIDPEAARKKKELKEAIAADGERAMAEYEANRGAVRVNTARLAALRQARDADAVVVATAGGDKVAKAVKTRRVRD